MEDIYSVKYIKNPKQWPYYKPFAWNANAMQNGSASFPMSKPKTHIRVKTNWIEGHEGDLSMLEAMTLISKTFR